MHDVNITIKKKMLLSILAENHFPHAYLMHEK